MLLSISGTRPHKLRLFLGLGLGLG